MTPGGLLEEHSHPIRAGFPRAGLSLLLWFAVRTLAGATEESPPASPQIREQVDVRLVLLEVLAVDRSGAHVFGLHKEDFEARENGVLVEISTFDEIGGLAERSKARRGRKPASGAQRRAPAARDADDRLRPAAGGADEPRRIVFLFDGYNNPSLLRLNQARRTAAGFVREKMKPGDQAAVFEISPFLSGVEYFTGDPTALARAIGKVRFFPTESLAKQVRDAQLQSGNLGSREEIARRLESGAELGASQAVQERRQFYQSMEDLAGLLSELPGRKMILLFSGGFPVVAAREERASGGFTEDFKRMVRRLAEARATVYAASIGEDIEAGDIEERASDLQALDALGFGADFLDRLGLSGPGADSTSSYQAILSVLASESGGSFFAGRDYGRFLSKVEDDSRHYYLLGYAPPEIARPLPEAARLERYRSIEVLVNRKGVSVRARRGRFPMTLLSGAPAPTATPAAAPPPGPQPTSAGDIAAEHEHNLTCHPLVFAGANGEPVVSLQLELRGQIEPALVPDGMALDISARLSARAGEKEVAAREDSFRVKASAEKASEVREGVRIVEGIVLPPGHYEIAASVRLNGLDVEASCSCPVSVSDFSVGELRLSDIALQGDSKALPVVADYFVTAAKSDPKPGLDPHRLANGGRFTDAGGSLFSRSTPLALFFRVYHPSTDPETGLPRKLALEYSLRETSGGEPVYPPVEILQFRRGTSLSSFDVVVRLEVSGLHAGAYRLLVDARDEANGSAASRERTITLF